MLHACSAGGSDTSVARSENFSLTSCEVNQQVGMLYDFCRLKAASCIKPMILYMNTALVPILHQTCI